ncbi:MAG: hypothetical protein RI922_1408 [Bacteroidota bacterium]|jgi:hypothetical protein
MKKELQSRLSRYTAAATAIVGAISGANGQIVYTDVNPDQTFDAVNNNGYAIAGLDLNNDATIDFLVASKDTTLAAGHLTFTLVAPYGTLGNAVAGDTPSSYDYAFAMNSGDAINASLNWISPASGGALSMAYAKDGAFNYASYWINGVTDKYLGLKFFVGSNAYYGWARLDVTAAGDVFTIKDYAYNGTANGAINAGQMAGINSLELETLLHFVNQADNSVKVVINGGLTEGKISLISAAGQVVSTGNVDSNEYNVSLNGLSAGIYVISAEFAEGTMTKKVIVH